MKKGKFIVIEGVDGSGKTTQIDLLKDSFKQEGIKFHFTWEPTDGPIGSIVRNILNKRIVSDERTIAALYLADRLDHIQNKQNGILQFLEQGIHVISSRYYFSSFAYQATENVSLDWLIDAHQLCFNLLKADISIFIDISPEESMRRLKKGRAFLDLFETEEKITQVRKGYHQAFERLNDSENIQILDGTQSEQEIAKEIWEKVSEIIS